MTSDTTKADQEAELARQADVIAAVAKANAEELPRLGGTVTTEVAIEREEEPVLTTELAKGKGRT